MAVFWNSGSQVELTVHNLDLIAPVVQNTTQGTPIGAENATTNRKRFERTLTEGRVPASLYRKRCGQEKADAEDMRFGPWSK